MSTNKFNNDIPEFFDKLLLKQYDENIKRKILEGYMVKRYSTLRVNTLKIDVQEVKKILEKENIKFEEVRWSNEALILKNATEKKIEELDIYKNGEIYFQSLSSMLPPIIMKPQENEDILDMCAAPGSKTTQLAMLTKNNANITACEFNKIRIEKLKFNIEKQGANSVFVMQKDARLIDDYFSFDRVLLDAPCSGSGTLNFSDENVFKYFTHKLIEKSEKLQLELLKKALKILKPGKEMIYSTCSILQCENEDIVNKALKESNAKIVPIEFEGMEELPILPTKISGTLCVCPTELYEGFFVAKIIKNY